VDDFGVARRAPPCAQDGPVSNSDLREAASVAHIYGKTVVAAESFTTDKSDPVWASPAYLKPLADNAMAQGVNRFIFHTSVHQPFVDDQHRPGITLGVFGRHYTRKHDQEVHVAQLQLQTLQHQFTAA